MKEGEGEEEAKAEAEGETEAEAEAEGDCQHDLHDCTIPTRDATFAAHSSGSHEWVERHRNLAALLIRA